MISRAPSRSRIVVMAVTMISCFAEGSVAQDIVTARSLLNQDAVEIIVDRYKDMCAVELGHSAEGTEFKVPDESIYDLVVGINGKTATVVYTEFKCGEVGYRWCGTGGCDFFLIVEGKIFGRYVSFPPQSVMIQRPQDQSPVIVYPLHGMQCQTLQAQERSMIDPCYGLAVWDERSKVFLSLDPDLKEIKSLESIHEPVDRSLEP